MSGPLRLGLFLLGVILLAPGACSAFILAVAPWEALGGGQFSLIWFLGAGLGALGVFLIVKAFSGRRNGR